MGKYPDSSTLLPNEWIKKAEDALRLGRLGRRGFLRMMGAAGVSMTAACTMADRALLQREAIAQSREELESSYDYIIVGAGAAGCVLAYRLTENPDVSVLVIEAGGSDLGNPLIAEPTIWFLNQGTPVDYAYTTTAQTGANNRILGCPRGKVFGGSTSINGLIWARGNPRDFNSWAGAGNYGWGWTNVLPLYQQLEAYTGPPSTLRGTSGPLHIEQPVNPNPLASTFLDAGVEVGLPLVADLNGASNFGVGWQDLIIKDQARNSAARAFLHPAMERPNLTVLSSARVRKLTMQGSCVTGVEIEQNGSIFTVGASEEVLLSAGAIDSPRVLMLSGIGPYSHLCSLGIPVVESLPVGDNLHDHVLVAGVVVQINGAALPPLRNNSSEAYLFWKSQSWRQAPDMQILMFEIPVTSEQFTPPPNAFTIAPALLRPRSRGTLRLASSDPNVAPIIDPQYLTHPDDMAVLVTALDLARQIAATNAYASIRQAEVLPGPQTLAEKENFIRNAALPYFHPVGTCRMGVDSNSVVGPDLKVHGINNLRVVDASIMPTITRGNTMAPSMLIAEKAACLIGV